MSEPTFQKVTINVDDVVKHVPALQVSDEDRELIARLKLPVASAMFGEDRERARLAARQFFTNVLGS